MSKVEYGFAYDQSGEISRSITFIITVIVTGPPAKIAAEHPRTN